MKNALDDNWLTGAFALGPFTFGNRIERNLRKEISFKDFSQDLHDQMELAGRKHFLPSRTVIWLYEIALRARVEKETAMLAVGLAKAWRKSEKRIEELIALLNTYPSFDPERMLRRSSGSKKGSRTRSRAVQLLKNLRDLRYQFRWWSRFAEFGPWRDSYRMYLISMDNHLKKRFVNSGRKERSELIEAVLDASGLNHKASAETILKALWREERRRT